MRVLVTWPPHVPSYFNAGHHLPTFTIAAYLRTQGYQVDALDAGALNCTWKEFGDQLFQNHYDGVVLVNEYDVVEGVRRAADYCKALLPQASLLTVGRLSYQNPDFFRSLPLAAIVCSGDYEAGVAAVLAWVAQGQPDDADVPGVQLNTRAGWRSAPEPGAQLQPEQWALPDVEEIPYAAYEALYHNDQNKFCGIPQRQELVVPVARGCPVGCAFCDVPPMQGLRERRLSVARTLAYIRACFARLPFEYVAFYAPTFTLNKRWVQALCDGLQTEPRKYYWKCATTLYHLDEDLIARMGAAGCVRISVGVETFEDEPSWRLPRVKHSQRDRFNCVVQWCHRAGIELNCFVIIGLPGASPEATRHTIHVVRTAGARVRPTVYTPYRRMRPTMSEREMSAFNRQTFVDESEIRSAGHEPQDFLQLFFGSDAYLTPATARIPRARELTSAASAQGLR